MFGRLCAFLRRKPAEGDVSVSKGTVEGVSRERETHDAVSHPSHYTSGNIEVIDFIEDQKMCYHLGNATKYICRAGKKDPSKEIEDLRKAVWYINRWIEVLRKRKEGDKHDV